MNRARDVLLWPLVAAVFVVVLFADLLPLPLDGYASQRFLLAGLLVVACTAASAIWIHRGGWQDCRQEWPVLALAATFILAAAPFADAPHAWVEPGMYAAFFSGFVFVGTLTSDDARRCRWVVILVYSGAITAALYGGTAILVYVFALTDQVTHLSTFIPWGFVNIRYWSHVASWLIPLLALAPLVGRLRDQRLWRFVCAAGAALWWWMVFLSSARGTMVGIAFGVVVALLFIGRPALPWLKVFLRYLAYGVLAWLLLSVLIPSLLWDEVGTRTLHFGSSGRMPLFIEAWRMSLEHFPFGMGPQSWLTHEALTEGYRRSSRKGHPHNMYLMWAAEYGWLMIGALLILVGQAIGLLWQRCSEVRLPSAGDKALSLAAFTASVSAALLHAGVSAVFIAPGSMLFGFLVLCVFWALISPCREAASGHAGTRRWPAIATAVMVATLGLFWLREVVVYHEAMEADRDARFDSVPYGTPPRFWYYGNFPRHSSRMDGLAPATSSNGLQPLLSATLPPSRVSGSVLARWNGRHS